MTVKKPTSHLVLLRDEHSGRDEMNLAGHPFALLQRPRQCNDNSIFYEWKRTINGREVTASWRVETPAAYGLPGPEEELLYLVLLQLTREAAEAAGTPAQWPLRVNFSRADVLARLGWDRGARRYDALELAFKRLQAVSISAKYAFYDARTKAPVNAVGFGIINEYSIADELKGRKSQGHLPLSHFEWNTVLHTSFLAGNVRSLALDFVISLEHPTSRRLFRLLELLRFASKPPRPQINIGIFKLRDRLGMTAYRYPSKVAEKLKSAADELAARGYIDGMSIEPDAGGAPMAVFRFGSAIAPHSPPEARQAPQKAVEAQERALPQGALPPLPGSALTFADLLPSFDAPSLPDAPSHDETAIDAFFEALPEDEQTEIRARVRAEMPTFLVENMNRTGAKNAMRRGCRRETLARYPQANRST